MAFGFHFKPSRFPSLPPLLPPSLPPASLPPPPPPPSSPPSFLPPPHQKTKKTHPKQSPPITPAGAPRGFRGQLPRLCLPPEGRLRDSPICPCPFVFFGGFCGKDLWCLLLLLVFVVFGGGRDLQEMGGGPLVRVRTMASSTQEKFSCLAWRRRRLDFVNLKVNNKCERDPRIGGGGEDMPRW